MTSLQRDILNTEEQIKEAERHLVSLERMISSRKQAIKRLKEYRLLLTKECNHVFIPVRFSEYSQEEVLLVCRICNYETWRHFNEV